MSRRNIHKKEASQDQYNWFAQQLAKIGKDEDEWSAIYDIIDQSVCQMAMAPGCSIFFDRDTIKKMLPNKKSLRSVSVLFGRSDFYEREYRD